MNQRIVTFGLIATFSLVGCTGVSDATSSAVTPNRPTANQSTPRSSTAAKNHSLESASTFGESAELSGEEPGIRIDVRSEPSTQASILYSGRVGDKIRASDATRDSSGRIWYKVRLASGIKGWVGGQFVSFIGDRNASPSVVMPGGTWIQAEPRSNARQIGQVQGGEILSASRRVSDNNGNTWFYVSKGWVSGEFLFQPTCIRFNGNSLMIVKVGGTNVLSEPTSQAKVLNHLKGGDALYPIRRLTKDGSEWFYTERGWVNGKGFFYPNCQNQQS